MNTPDHYKSDECVKEEPIEILYRSLSYPAFKGYCIGNILKYISRFERKGGDEDLNKAENYIEFLRCAHRGESPLYAVRKK